MGNWSIVKYYLHKVKPKDRIKPSLWIQYLFINRKFMYSIGAKSSGIAVAEPGGWYHSQTKLSQWVEVLVDCPGCSDLFTYKIPAQLAIKPGDIFKCAKRL
jgi:hypothetical protein